MIYHLCGHRFVQDYEEVIVPPAAPTPTRSTERQKPIAELDEIVRGSFSVRANLVPDGGS